MLESILGVFLLFCSVLGIVWLWGRLMAWFYFRRGGPESFRLLAVEAGDELIEYRLRRAEGSLRWERWSGETRLILLDLGADEETLAVCHAFLRGRDWVSLCTPGELEALLLAKPPVCKRAKGVLY